MRSKMVLGIVGAEAAKFTAETEAKSKAIIREYLTASEDVTGVCSGHCHLGGIDIWAEEIGKELGLEVFSFPPKNLSWETGYKVRNILIAENSDIVLCITVKELPANYTGMRFKLCYHCKTDSHIKSGGCWTAKYAQSLGKKAYWEVVS